MRIHRSVLQLGSAHFFLDSYSSMLGAFLPFLVPRLGLSLTQAGMLGGILIFSGSFLQPLYGVLADRFHSRVFTALGPVLAGLFISSLGVAESFTTLAVLVFLGGVGIASFHPQGASIASASVPGKAGFQLAVFITCGTIGYSLGPTYITTVIEWAGIDRSWIAAIPGFIASAYLIWAGPSPLFVERKSRKALLVDQIRGQAQPLLLLFMTVVIRSAVQLSFVSFLPLYLSQRGWSAASAGRMLSLFLLIGGVFSFTGGVLSDRIGGKAVIVTSMATFVPLLMGFLLTRGAYSMLFCFLGAGALLLTLPVHVAMAQRLVPLGASTVSALMMGFAWGVGGAVVPLVGLVSDRFGLENVLIALVLLCIPGFFLALFLPSRNSMREIRREAISEVESATV